MQLLNGNEVITPTEADQALAEESGRKLEAHLGSDAKLSLEVEGKREELKLPRSALKLLVRVLAELGQGNAISVTPLRAELTTQQAADHLNVSRQHLVNLLEEGAMPFRMVGSHRRILLTDLLAYEKEWNAKRHAALAELTALSQELDMGY